MAGELAYHPDNGQLVYSPNTGQLAMNCLDRQPCENCCPPTDAPSISITVSGSCDAECSDAENIDTYCGEICDAGGSPPTCTWFFFPAGCVGEELIITCDVTTGFYYAVIYISGAIPAFSGPGDSCSGYPQYGGKISGLRCDDDGNLQGTFTMDGQLGYGAWPYDCEDCTATVVIS